MQNNDDVDDLPDDEDVTRLDIETVVQAFDAMPILARLQFARRLVFMRDGEKGSLDAEPSMVAAVAILDGVIDVLRGHPTAANLRWADEPQP